MNKKSFLPILSLCIFVLLCSGFSYAGWQKSTQTATPHDLNEVKFINPLTGWACGGEGALIKTVNGGANWTVIPSGMTQYVNTVHFVNALTGWIGYDVNTFYKTTDGGDTWVNQPLSGTGTINRVYAINSQKVFVAGANGKLYRTLNGGTNWVVVDSSIPDYNRFSVVDAQTIWISGSNNLVRTTNGGDTWMVVPLTGSNKDLSFLNAQTGWVVNFPNVKKTTNAGDTWQSYLAADSGNIFDGVRFVNAHTGFVIGSSNNFYKGRIFKSTDGGASWIKQNVYPQFGFYGMEFVNSYIGYVVGDGGMVYKTITGGDAATGWIYAKTSETDNDLNEVRFLNALTGWACGGNGALIKSVDGGASWTLMNSGTAGFVNSVFFVNNNTGWIADDVSKILKTTDGGDTWVNQGNYPTGILRLHAFNDQTCIATGVDGRLFKTTDGGTSWNTVFTGSSDLNRICFVDNLTGYITGANKLYKTTDGATTWSTINLAGSNRDVTFINAQTGWIPNHPNVMKTTDGGATWTSHNVGVAPGGYFFGLRFVDATTGFVIGVGYADGKIFKTTDGGVTWFGQTIPTVYGIYGLHFHDALTGWAVGSGGNTFRTVDGGLTFVSQSSAEMPDKFSLQQNYPNPFNPSTKINYQIKNSDFISLKVFSMLGKEVATLVNERQTPGSYTVDFNAANLPSGIYFYTLVTSDLKETKKMILVK